MSSRLLRLCVISILVSLAVLVPVAWWTIRDGGMPSGLVSRPANEKGMSNNVAYQCEARVHYEDAFGPGVTLFADLIVHPSWLVIEFYYVLPEEAKEETLRRLLGERIAIDRHAGLAYVRLPSVFADGAQAEGVSEGVSLTAIGGGEHLPALALGMRQSVDNVSGDVANGGVLPPEEWFARSAKIIAAAADGLLDTQQNIASYQETFSLRNSREDSVYREDAPLTFWPGGGNAYQRSQDSGPWKGHCIIKLRARKTAVSIDFTKIRTCPQASEVVNAQDAILVPLANDFVDTQKWFKTFFRLNSGNARIAESEWRDLLAHSPSPQVLFEKYGLPLAARASEARLVCAYYSGDGMAASEELKWHVECLLDCGAVRVADGLIDHYAQELSNHTSESSVVKPQPGMNMWPKLSSSSRERLLQVIGALRHQKPTVSGHMETFSRLGAYKPHRVAALDVTRTSSCLLATSTSAPNKERLSTAKKYSIPLELSRIIRQSLADPKASEALEVRLAELVSAHDRSLTPSEIHAIGNGLAALGRQWRKFEDPIPALDYCCSAELLVYQSLTRPTLTPEQEDLRKRQHEQLVDLMVELTGQLEKAPEVSGMVLRKVIPSLNTAQEHLENFLDADYWRINQVPMPEARFADLEATIRKEFARLSDNMEAQIRGVRDQWAQDRKRNPAPRNPARLGQDLLSSEVQIVDRFVTYYYGMAIRKYALGQMSWLRNETGTFSGTAPWGWGTKYSVSNGWLFRFRVRVEVDSGEAGDY